MTKYLENNLSNTIYLPLIYFSAALILREESLGQVMHIVSQISQERIYTMRRQVMHIYEQYFSSVRAITLTTLQIINDRVFPYAAKKYEEWNEPPVRVCSMLIILKCYLIAISICNLNTLCNQFKIRTFCMMKVEVICSH